MNPQIITTVAAALGMLVALWTIMSNFDKRDEGRFKSLREQIRSMGTELQTELRESGDRGVIQK